MTIFTLKLSDVDGDNFKMDAKFDPPLTDAQKDGSEELPFVYGLGIQMVMGIMQAHNEDDLSEVLD